MMSIISLEGIPLRELLKRSQTHVAEGSDPVAVDRLGIKKHLENVEKIVESLCWRTFYIDKVGFNRFQLQFKSIKSDCLGNHFIPPPTHDLVTAESPAGFDWFVFYLFVDLKESPKIITYKSLSLVTDDLFLISDF